MRHRVAKVKLSRDKDHTKSLKKNLATALVLNDKITTTLAKAKAIRPDVEKLVTLAVKSLKANDKIIKFNTIKALSKNLTTPNSVKKILEDIAVRFEKTSGGYTRIIKLPNRLGDNSSMARIEFTVMAVHKKRGTKKLTKVLKEPKDEEDE